MDWLREALFRLTGLFRRRRDETEMAEEMSFHLESETAVARERGLPEDEARQSAARAFGGIEQAKEEAREARRTRWIEEILQDVRYGLRMLRKNPGFTTITVLTLALGTGATTAIFSVVNGVVLRPLPYRNAHELVSVRAMNADDNWLLPSRMSARAWAEQSESVASFATASYWPTIMTGEGEPSRHFGLRLSPNYFSTLGVQPILGRDFLPEEGTAGRDNVVILSHRLWVTRFNGRPDVVGRKVLFDDRPCTVIGVLPDNFMPETITDPAIFSPDATVYGETTRQGRLVEVVGRLKAGYTVEQAGREVQVISARLALESPDTNKGWGARVIPLLDAKVAETRPFLWMLLGAVGFLLLIACVNVANLLLARSSARAKEIALRAALGASRGRIIRQLLWESILIALLGSLLGILVAKGAMGLLLSHAPLSLPRVHEIAIDATAFAFSCGLAVLTGIGFGLVPALQASRTNLPAVMNDASRGSSEGGRGLRLRSALVVAEVSLALVLLMAAGLLMRSFVRLQEVPLGYDPGVSYVSKMMLPLSRYPSVDHRVQFVNHAIERLSAVPGVEAVVFSTIYPSYGSSSRPIEIESRPDIDPRVAPMPGFFASTPDYFPALKIPLRQGREFTIRDDPRSPPVAIVSRSFAEKYFPSTNPLGQRIRPAEPKQPWREIVGVVEDVHDRGPLLDRPFQVYIPYAQEPTINPSLMVRVTGEFAGLEPLLRRAIGPVDPAMPLSFVGLGLREFMNETIAPQRYALFLFMVFAGVALLLCALGIYGVVAYSVTRRTHEIGIRMALGAQRGDILRMIFSQTGRMVGLGLALGVIGAFAATRLISTLLFGIGTHDAATFVAVPALLGLVALAACWIPARRAAKVDPMIALRET